MTEQVLYSGDLSLAELEIELNLSEATFFGLDAITARDGGTLATFSGTREEPGRLRIVLDRDGAQPAADERVAVRGEAVVKKAPVKIVIFRPRR